MNHEASSSPAIPLLPLGGQAPGTVSGVTHIKALSYSGVSGTLSTRQAGKWAPVVCICCIQIAIITQIKHVSQLPDFFRKPIDTQSSTRLPHSTHLSSSSMSTHLLSVTLSLFRSILKTYFFHKSFYPHLQTDFTDDWPMMIGQ